MMMLTNGEDRSLASSCTSSITRLRRPLAEHLSTGLKEHITR